MDKIRIIDRAGRRAAKALAVKTMLMVVGITIAVALVCGGRIKTGVLLYIKEVVEFGVFCFYIMERGRNGKRNVHGA